MEETSESQTGPEMYRRNMYDVRRSAYYNRRRRAPVTGDGAPIIGDGAPIIRDGAPIIGDGAPMHSTPHNPVVECVLTSSRSFGHGIQRDG